uniref:Disease resistance protein n=1 Tax=Vitis vinifera TaxID=29760 RepID=F6I464_VITVI
MDRFEAEFIEDIIGEIRRLIPKLVHVGENMVGMDENLKEVKSLIDAQSNEVSMVGIYGIGKTTIAKVVYNDMLVQFKRHNFLENVREKSKDDDVGIPHDIRNLSSLLSLSLSNCNLMEGEILNHIWQLSSLEKLSLDRNHFSSLPAGISQLSNLKGLKLSHCKNLLQIPELPSSVQFLDAHWSDGISSRPSVPPIRSLINCFKSELIPVGGQLEKH